MIDSARAALMRYYGYCLRAEMRARAVLARRQERTAQALQEIRDYDHDLVLTGEQMQANGRAIRERRVRR